MDMDKCTRKVKNASLVIVTDLLSFQESSSVFQHEITPDSFQATELNLCDHAPASVEADL